MRKTPIAIFISDLHLSLTAPVWRDEPDWFAAMDRPLKEIRDLQRKYDIPVFCAGDIFHVYYCTPELINFALEALPERLYSIPGNHDLPDHNLKEIKRSAFWTLVQSGRIQYLPEYEAAGYVIQMIPYGKPIVPPKATSKAKILLTHRYVWIKDHNYKNAPEENRVVNIKEIFDYDIAVFGDNHNPFSLGAKEDNHQIWNCGTIIRRRSDESHYRPWVGLLTTSDRPAGLAIEPYFLSTDDDKYLENVGLTPETDNLDLSLFIHELEKLGDTNLSFENSVKRYIQKHKPKKSIQDILYKAIEVK